MEQPGVDRNCPVLVYMWLIESCHKKINNISSYIMHNHETNIRPLSIIATFLLRGRYVGPNGLWSEWWLLRRVIGPNGWGSFWIIILCKLKLTVLVIVSQNLEYATILKTIIYGSKIVELSNPRIELPRINCEIYQNPSPRYLIPLAYKGHNGATKGMNTFSMTKIYLLLTLTSIQIILQKLDFNH